MLNKYERRLKAGKVEIKGIEPAENTRIITLLEKFMYQNHMILIFEKLDMSLFDLLKIANF